jgi:hypothetical protein
LDDLTTVTEILARPADDGTDRAALGHDDARRGDIHPGSDDVPAAERVRDESDT